MSSSPEAGRRIRHSFGMAKEKSTATALRAVCSSIASGFLAFDIRLFFLIATNPSFEEVISSRIPKCLRS
uniref:Ovule protein n=1 Tax=Parascaris univalens TaxID=6257 RepID=A0A915A888_PARUN